MHAIKLLLSSVPALAHMQLHHPAPFNASNNPHRTTSADTYLQYPYDCCGPNDRWMWPCRGYESLLGTPDGAPTAIWTAGSSHNWSLSGIGNHYGGSCQVGFSVDRGNSFHVATSYEGNCPQREGGNGPAGQEFQFTVPSDLPAGVAIFAWVWYNREQELNMNCAAVNITTSVAVMPPSYTTASHASREFKASKIGASNITSSSVAFSGRPLMFVADDGNDCTTPKSTAELRYPNPGPDIVVGDGVYPLELPSGECGVKGMMAKQAYHGKLSWSE